MDSNHISLDGNHNIVIQDAQNSYIYVNSDEGAKQLLAEQGGQINQILAQLQTKPEPLLQQFAQKIYQVGKIDNANFYFYTEPKVKKHLTPPPFIPELFIGRETDLKTIHQKLFTGDNLLLLVNGQGGIGKTTLAAKYWEKYQDQYSHVAWIFVGNSLLEALLSLAKELHLSFQEKMSNQERLPILLKALNDLEKPCLLVLDNVNNINELEQYYLALRSCANFHLLLTTRIMEFGHADFLSIKPLSIEAAIELFHKHYPRYQNNERQLLEPILDAVGLNTLVVELMAKNLRTLNRISEQYRLEDLLKDLQNKGLLAISKSEIIPSGYHAQGFALRQEKPEDVIAAMYDLGELDASEKQLLSILSVLPANNIHYDYIKALSIEKVLPLTSSNGEKNEKKLQKSHSNSLGKVVTINNIDHVLFTLVQKGWLEFDKEDSTFKISPVVQEIVRLKHENLYYDCKVLINNLLDKLDYVPGVRQIKNENQLEVETYAKLGSYVVNHIRKDQFDIAILCRRLGNFFQISGNLEKALDYYHEYNRILRTLSEQSPNIYELKNHLAISYEKLSNVNLDLEEYSQSIKFLEESYQIQELLVNKFKKNYRYKSNLSIILNQLGIVYARLEEYSLSIFNFEKALKIRLELNKLLPNSIRFKQNLGFTYLQLGKTYMALGSFEEANHYYVKFNELEKRLFQMHPEHLGIREGLASSYEEFAELLSILKNVELASEYFNLSVELRQSLTRTYPYNIGFRTRLASLYYKKGCFLFKTGSYVDAKQCQLDSEVLWVELIKFAPEYFHFQRYLDQVRQELSKIDLLTS